MGTTRTPARYDGLSDWYHATGADWYADAVTTLLGAADGPCLDLGCGTGHHFAAIRATGRTPVGVDLSTDQIQIARSRTNLVAQANAETLPFANDVFPAALAVWVSTDIDDFAAAMREVARVLAPGGRLVVLGVHPCFNGPCVENRADGVRVVHPNYRESRWHYGAPWWGEDGIRSRVGMRHLPLAEFMNALLDSDVVIERVVEPGPDAIPAALAIVARQP